MWVLVMARVRVSLYLWDEGWVPGVPLLAGQGHCVHAKRLFSLDLKGNMHLKQYGIYWKIMYVYKGRWWNILCIFEDFNIFSRVGPFGEIISFAWGGNFQKKYFKKKEKKHAFDQEKWKKTRSRPRKMKENKTSTKKRKQILRSFFLYKFPPQSAKGYQQSFKSSEQNHNFLREETYFKKHPVVV